MDKKLGSFLNYSSILVLLSAALIAAFVFIYRSFTLITYNRILLILILLSILITVVIASAMLAIYTTLRRRKVSRGLFWPARLGMKLVVPFATAVTGMLNGDKDIMRGIFIELNNIFVESGMLCFKPGQLLILLPHCLQNSDCVRKITGDISNCKQCGRCTIGPISALAAERGVRAAVVTGGTAARNLVARLRPRMLLSVACERDLSHGIADTGGIPVVGIVNGRPNGPCFNTTVDVELVRQKLDSMLGRRRETSDEG